MVEVEVYVRVGPISIVDLVHLTVLALLPPLACWDAPRASPSANCVGCTTIIVNSERVVTPSRHG